MAGSAARCSLFFRPEHWLVWTSRGPSQRLDGRNELRAAESKARSTTQQSE